MTRLFSYLAASCIIGISYIANADQPPIEEITVTAELLESNVLALPNSVTVIDNTAINQRSAQHLEELLNLAPNVNFASGASRGRFIQIRGIGERSEFQEPINSSVGVVIDGIDFTGISTVASTLDVQQVEVLRGPQGTLFGANALAGLINVVSNKPTDEFYGRVSAAIEDFDGRELSGVISGPASDSSSYRLAVKHYQSNGFTEDVFLDRDDTNNIDETTARARYVAQVNERLELDFTVFLADIDNGFDAFSLDNTRQTYSDNPGVDRAETLAGSVKARYQISNSLAFEGLISAADSDLEYSFDEDWSNVGICDGTACDPDLLGFDLFYVSFDQYRRANDNTSVDLRLVSNQSESLKWAAGFYYRDQSIDLTRDYTFNEGLFTSTLDTTNSAAYGQVNFALSDNWSLTTGLRLEQRETDYVDNSPAQSNTDEDLWGGRIALEYQASERTFYYGLVSRGYKPGGFNLDGSIAPEQREFDTETMLNFEVGAKHTWLEGRLWAQFALFYQDRDDIQTKQSIVRSQASGELGGLCPCSFTDFTDNATSGSNKGLEVELSWDATERLNLFWTLGLLDTEFDTFLTFENVNADRDNGIPVDLAGREQAHSPSYQTVLGGSFSITESLSLSGSIEAKDGFLFSNRHDERSDAYELLNLELSYNRDNWNIALYAKNVTDELVKTRGFGSFGNDPRKNYITEPYNQFAAPRIVGLKASLEF